MTQAKHFIPEGYTSITPYLILKGAAKALDFYKSVFGAEEIFRMPGKTPDLIGHAEMKIGNSVIMLADEHAELGYLSPKTIGKTPVSLMLYCSDVDGVVAKAVAAGAKITLPIEDKFYGDRAATLEDPFGHLWTVATHKEDLTPKEIEERAKNANH